MPEKLDLHTATKKQCLAKLENLKVDELRKICLTVFEANAEPDEPAPSEPEQEAEPTDEPQDEPEASTDEPEPSEPEVEIAPEKAEAAEVWRGEELIRTYTKELHGDDFIEIAQGMAHKNGFIVKLVEEAPAEEEAPAPIEEEEDEGELVGKY